MFPSLFDSHLAVRPSESPVRHRCTYRHKFEEESGISLEAMAVEDEVAPGPAVPQDDTMSDHDLALLLQVGY